VKTESNQVKTETTNNTTLLIRLWIFLDLNCTYIVNNAPSNICISTYFSYWSMYCIVFFVII
jgi:hypothetical protein